MSDPSGSDPASATLIRQSVELRGRVGRLAASDPGAARAVAQTIPHPWYRCQALTELGRRDPGPGRASLIGEAFAAGRGCHDPNRRVEAVCGPLALAVDSGEIVMAQGILGYAMQQLAADQDALSRWAAVSVLWVIKDAEALTDRFHPAFVAATASGHGWRVERAIARLLEDPAIRRLERYRSHLELRREALRRWREMQPRT